jgi:[1-hydroxy-2-(trimethylamino)ethyl]phosphonate dioxygenase
MKLLSSVDEVFELLASGGGEAYFCEPVTVLEHSLQAAWFVQRAGADEPLITAALLHDLGHLMHGEGEDAATRGLDTQHEELAVAALGEHLPPSVLDPIRLHVAAKRYLCFAKPDYLRALSPASVQSLALQGGPMGAAESEAFLVLPHARAALSLRRADDAAKVRDLKVPQLDAYRTVVESVWH